MANSKIDGKKNKSLKRVKKSQHRRCSGKAINKCFCGIAKFAASVCIYIFINGKSHSVGRQDKKTTPVYVWSR